MDEITSKGGGGMSTILGLTMDGVEKWLEDNGYVYDHIDPLHLLSVYSRSGFEFVTVDWYRNIIHIGII